MIWLAAPLGLLALLALAVPLVVHLWRPPPRTIRVGSLRLLREASRLPVRDLRWRDRLLLLLRCALLAVAAVLLAQPLWPRASHAGARWALRSVEAVPTAEQAAAWAQLLAEGFEERWLAPGFPRERPDLVMPQDTWSLLAEADARLGDGQLAILAPPSVRSLTGSRPALRRAVRWVESAGPGEAARLLGRTPAGQVVLEVSTPQATRRLTVDPTADPALPARTAKLQTRATADGLEAALDGAPLRPLPLLAPPRVGVLAAADRAEDERRIRAAVRALGWPLVAPTEATEVAIVLGEVPAPAGASLVLRDGGGAESQEVNATFAGQRLFRRAARSEAGPARLRDGFGDPLLSERVEAGRRTLTLATRFHPDWMEAAGTSALPLWLADTLAPGAPAQIDHRLADLRQAQPALAAPAASRFALPAALPTDLSRLLWWLLAALLAGERLLSHRTADPAG